jgi:hypothetical protein
MLLPFLVSGCESRTFGESNLRNFNSDFGQYVEIEPEYQLSNIGAGIYSISMHQGGVLISEGSSRFSLLQNAAFMIAIKTCDGKEPAAFETKKHGEASWVHLTGFFRCISDDESKNQPIPHVLE